MLSSRSTAVFCVQQTHPTHYISMTFHGKISHKPCTTAKKQKKAIKIESPSEFIVSKLVEKMNF